MSMWTGPDRIDAGDVIIRGNPGDYDLVLAGTVIDTIYSFESVNRVRDGADGDALYGGAGDNTLFGEDGNDRVWDFERGVNLIQLTGSPASGPVISSNGATSFIDWGATSIAVYNTQIDMFDLLF
ncbi:hypothetical protein [Sagittula sp. SSi028]|uniref:hypothetical protein n=1 Tax=Sagittula sp. SSi028 TaxID=3400636 RepID=UPI003AF8124E